MKFKPLSNRVLIEPVKVEEATASGIIIPDAAKEKPLTGKVIAVGPGKVGVPLVVKINDVVLYGKYSGKEVNIEDEDYLLMFDDDIYGIF